MTKQLQQSINQIWGVKMTNTNTAKDLQEMLQNPNFDDLKPILKKYGFDKIDALEIQRLVNKLALELANEVLENEQLKIQQEHARQGKFGEMNEAEIEELEKLSEENEK